MRVDTNFYGTVPMPDAGDPSVHPKERRYGNADCIACYENLLHWARTADGLGFDTMWLTEHHFQYEGWHPLRLAEDFALADILTGGRMEFGVGRGTVPRETFSLGGVVASRDNAMSDEHNRRNREMFEEAIEVIKAAWYNERFEFRGKHFTFPPDGIPDRGSVVKDLTLIPKPRRPIDIYQACSSPDTIEYVPRAGHRAVYWLNNPVALKAKWDRFAEIRDEIGKPAAPGADRVLVFNGSPVPDGYHPTVDDSRREQVQVVGSIDDVVDTIGMHRDLLSLKHICLFFDYPGLTRPEIDEQMHLMMEEVFPRLGEPVERRPLPGVGL